MALRNISNEIKNALANNDSLLVYHLVKFEKPSQLAREAEKATDYVYLTDAPYEITYDANDYHPGGVLRVGKVPENTEAKATSLALTLSAAKLGKQASAVSVTNSSIAADSTGTLTVDFDLFKSGFYAGDTVKFTKRSDTTVSFRARIDRLYGDGTKIDITSLEDTAISANSSVSFDIRFDSSEVDALVAGGVDNSGSETTFSSVSFDNYINRSVTIYRVFADPADGSRIGDPVLLFKGIIAKGTLNEKAQGTSTITWSLTSHWGDFVRVNGRITSDEFHRGLDSSGISSEDSAIRPEYIHDLGFMHADSSLNVLATYTDIASRYKMVKRGGLAGLAGMKKLKEEKYEVTREMDLSINLDAKYIPLVYGVQKVDTIPVFADVVITQDTNEEDNVANGKTELFQAQVLCEGPIGGVYDIYMEDKSLVCRDKADSDVRLGSADDIPCFGRMDRGDVLSGGNLFTNTPMSEILYGSTEDLENTDIWRHDPNVVMQFPRLYSPNTGFQNSTTGQNGILHRQSFRATLANDIQITLHAGREDQEADQTLLGLANSQDFLVQQQYYQDDATTYWTANHKLLDTAYIVTRDSLTAEDGKAPDLSFVVRGKFIDCHNYDGSYRISNGLQSNFALGDEVSITLADGTTSAGTARIIDKWSFLNASNLLEYRIRLGEFSSASAEDTIITTGDVGKFSITKDSNTLTFLSPEYSNNPDAPVSPTDELAAAGFVFSGSDFTNKSIPLERKVTNVTTYEPIYINTADGPEMIGTEPVVRKNYKYTLDFSSLPTFTQNTLKVAKETSALVDLTVTANSHTQTMTMRMADLDDSNMEYIVTGLSGDMEALFGNPSNTAGTTTVTGTGANFVNRSLIIQNSSDTLDPTDTEGVTVEITEEDVSPHDYSIRMPSTTALRTFCNTNNILCLHRGLHTRFNIANIKYKYGVKGTHLDIEQWGDFRVSTNPAMQLLDYLTSDRYGKGLELGTDLDVKSFREVARSCDTRSDITLMFANSVSISNDEVYRYPTTGALLWEGKVSNVETVTYDGTSYKQVTFTNCIGKFGRKWNNWYSYPLNELVWTTKGYWAEVSTAGTISSAPTQAASITVNLRKVWSGADTDIAIDTSLHTNIGNPFVKKIENGNVVSGYSLYDSDDVKYWKYVGWDTPDQRFVTRHQTNMTIDTSQSLFDNVNSMLRQFNGILRFANGKYYLDQRVKAKAISDFTSDEIITEDYIVGDIKISDKGISKTFNSVNAQVIDPANNFKPRSIAFYNSNYKKQDKNIPRQGNYEAPGISNYFNARMNIKQVLDESRAGLDISFTMAPRGYMLLAGNLIAITYDKFNWTKKLFRIESLNTRDDLLVDIVAKEHNDNAYVIESPASDLVASYAQESGGKPPVKVRVPTSLTASDNGGGGIDLSWTNADNYNDATHTVEIWRGTSTAFSSAELIGTTKGTKYTDQILETGAQTRYYWIRYSIRSVNSIGNPITKHSKYEPRSTANGVSGNALSITTEELNTGVTVNNGGVTFPDNPTGTPTINAGITSIGSGNSGFFLGYDGSNHVFQVGNPSGNNLKFDGTDLALTGSEFSVTASGATTPSINGTTTAGKGALLKADGDVFFGDANGFSIFFDQSEGTLTLTGEMVTENNLTTDSISADKIQANAITTDTLAANVITAKHITADSVVASLIQASTIEASHVKANSVVASLIDSETITSNHIKSNSIVATIIDATSITASDIQTATLSALSANLGDITAGTMKGGNIPDANSAPTSGESGAFMNLTDGKMVFGNSSKYILFDGTDLELSGVTIDANSIVNATAPPELTVKEDGTQELDDAQSLNFTTGFNVSSSGTEATISIATASDTAQGGIRTGFTVDNTNKNYPIVLNASGQAYVNVPWSAGTTNTEAVQDIVGAMFGSNTETRITAEYDDTNGKINLVVDDMNDTYTLPTASSTTLGGIKIGSRLSIDGSGVLSANQQTANDFTTTLKTKLENIAEDANNYSLPTATSTVLGGVKDGARVTIAADGTLSANVQSDENFTSTLKTKLEGIDTEANNYSLPTATATELGGVKIGSGININSGTISAATQSDENFTSAFKTKLNDIEEDANNYSLPTASSSTLGGVKIGSGISIDANGAITAGTQSDENFTSALKTKLEGIDTEANNYSLPTATTTELGGVKDGARITIDANGVISADVQSDENFTSALKTKLNDIEEDANNYSLPTATSTELGGVKIGTGISISSGTISADTQSDENFTSTLKTKLEGIEEGAKGDQTGAEIRALLGTATSSTSGLVKIGYTENNKNYPVELSNGQMFVNVPWTDNNTTYTAGSGLSLSGSNEFSVDNTVVRTTGTQTIAGNKTFSNNVVVSGNLTVSGTTTTINTTNLTIEDNIIVVNSAQAGTPASTVTAGLEVERGDSPNKRFVYAETGLGPDSDLDGWSFGSERVEAGTFYGTFVGDVTGTPSSLAGLTTDNLAEGTNNLYYTDARVIAALSGGSGIDKSAAGEFTVDSTVIRTTGGQSIAGTTTLNRLNIHNGGPTLELKDTTDDDDHHIYFKNSAGSVVYSIDTQNATSGDALTLYSSSQEIVHRIGTANIFESHANIVKSLKNFDVTGNISVSGTVDGRDLATDGAKLDNIAANATNTAAPAISTNGSTPALASGITGEEVRSLIGAGTSSLALGTTATTALRGDTAIPTVNNPAITLSAGNAGITMDSDNSFTLNQSGAETITISHADTSSQTSVDNSGGTVIQDITLDTFGHITAINSTDLDGRYFTETESDARYLRKDSYNSNWTRLGYGTSGTAYWHKLAEVTINGSWKDYQLRCDWTDRYNHGTLNIHIHSDGDTTADIWDAYVQQFGKSNRIPTSHFKYYKSGSTVQVWIYTPGWREWDYIRTDAVTEGTPTIVWYKEGDSGAGKTTTEPTGLTEFDDYTPWHPNNDGAGSGLNADLLDGNSSDHYLNYNNLTNKPTIPTDTNYYLNGISKSGNTLTFSVNGATDQTYTFGSNAFTSTTIPTNNNQLTNGAGYVTTDTNYYLNGISRSGNTLTFSVNGATDQTYTFGSNAFTSTTIPTNNNQLTNGANYITNASASLNADKITSGTINNARLSTDMQLTSNAPRYRLEESGVTNTPNWWMIADGGNYSIRLNNTGTYPLTIQTNSDNNAVTSINLGYNTSVTGTLTATNLSGAGAAITSLNASNLGSGTVPSARLPDNIFDSYRRSTIDNSSQDFDNYTTTGTYHVNNWSESGDVVANGPTGAYPWGMLRVTNWQDSDGSGNTYVLQEYFPDQTDTCWTRIIWNGTPRGWRESWGSGSDGASSGLDADKLDGQHGSYYAAASSINNATITLSPGTGLSTGGAFTTNQGSNETITFNLASTMSPRTATELSSSVNLDSLGGSEAGFYYQTANADTTNNNYPNNHAGSLIVQKSAGEATQLYQTYNSTDTRLYFRSQYTGNYGTWQRVFADNYHPNADTLTTARSIGVTLSGDVTGTGSANFNGSAGIDIAVTTTGGGGTDLTALTDMTQTITTSDEFVVLDSNAPRRKAASEVISDLNIVTGNVTGTLFADVIIANKIETDMLKANTITADKIAANLINADKIAAGSITAEQLQISNNASGSAGIYMDYNNGNSRIDIRDSSALRVRIGYLA